MRGVMSSIELDADKLVAKARSIPTIDGMDLAKVVSTKEPYKWTAGTLEPGKLIEPGRPRHKVVAYDYGIKPQHSPHAGRGLLRRDRRAG